MTDREEDNPFASPHAVDDPPAKELFDFPACREGDELVAPNRALLPMRCYVCNGPGEVPQSVAITGWFSLRGVAIRVSVLAFLCRRHKNRSRWRSLASVPLVICLVLGLGALGALADELELPTWLLAALLLALVSAVLAINNRLGKWAGEPLKVSGVEKNQVWLSGAGEDYLASLPYASEVEAIAMGTSPP